MNNKRFNATRASGFTLIEILLVMLITSVLVLGANAAFRQAHLFWSRVEDEEPVYQQSRLVFDTLRQELACLYLPQGNEEQQLPPFSLSSLPDGTTQLSFYTLNSAWRTAAISSYPAKVNYTFSTDTQSEQPELKRNEQLCSGEKAISDQTKPQTILTGLAEFHIWAIDHDSEFAADSWKDNLECKTSPPKAVKIQLKWLAGDERKTYDFQTIIEINTQSQLSTTPSE